MSETPPINPVAEAFGNVVKEAREQEGQSQQELANKTALNRTFISFLERGLRQPSLTTVLTIAKALHISAGKLVARVERTLPRRNRK